MLKERGRCDRRLDCRVHIGGEDERYIVARAVGRGSSGNAEDLGLATGVYSVTSIGEGVVTKPMSAFSDSSNEEEPRSDASRSCAKGSLSLRHVTAAAVLSVES
ncbi:unnamed protein product [Haemonchus placei]|uniref:Uncharacterized protein n=1 Tax=Haemonchus placei TaxID=6290 RepID=A0A0N4W4Q7_HAEPC|nr:unnamed protein product [Haemonchus placei]